MKRRHFLISSAVTTAAARTGWAQASDRVRVAVIGVGSRGSAHIREMLPVQNVEIAALVDPDGRRTEQASGLVHQKTGKRPKLESDMRRVFDDKEIDAVTVATTNHWHALTAIWAMRAGKDAFVEKPVSHNIHEGITLVETARKYKRVSAGCTQRRYWGRFRKAIELLHSGVIGDIYQGNFFFPGNRDSIGVKPPMNPPEWLNWDLWVGPAPMQPYHENLVHYNWHWFWDFGNGELGNNGIHMIDILRWGMRQTLPVKVYSSGGRFGVDDQAQTPNSQNVSWTFADGSIINGELRGLYTGERMHWDFFGAKGHLHLAADGRHVLTLGRNKQPEPEPEYPANIDHMANFVAAVRSRDSSSIPAEIEQTHLSTTLCHLGNISYRLRRELHFDPHRMEFPGDDVANRLLSRPYRAPYTLPDPV